MYAVSLSDPNSCVRLSEAGFSHTCVVGKSVFVDMKSSLTHPNELQMHRLVFDQKSGLPRAEKFGNPLLLDSAKESPFLFAAPKMFSIRSNNFTLYGATYFPPNFDPSKKYPAVVYVYGGPGVQLVENTYFMTKGSQSVMANTRP